MLYSNGVVLHQTQLRGMTKILDYSLYSLYCLTTPYIPNHTCVESAHLSLFTMYDNLAPIRVVSSCVDSRKQCDHPGITRISSIHVSIHIAATPASITHSKNQFLISVDHHNVRAASSDVCSAHKLQYLRDRVIPCDNPRG